MSGGHATAAGIEYQGQVGAWVAAHILSSQSLSELAGIAPQTLQMEAPSPVDDIVVQASDGGVWFLNVKTAVSTSKNADSELASVADQFVRQWLEGVSSGQASRAFDEGRDRLVLVTKPAGRRSFARLAGAVINRMRDGIGSGGGRPSYSAGEVGAFEALEAQLKFYFEKHTGAAPGSDVLNRLISSIRLVEFEMVGSVEAAIKTVLSRVVVDEDLPRALSALVNACIDFSRRRSGGDIETLREVLRAGKVGLIQAPAYAADFERLREMTRHSLVDMSRYSTIRVEGLEKPIQLRRACCEALLAAVERRASCLVIGEPGAGKSGALQLVAGDLVAAGRTVLMIQVDQLGGTTIADLQRDFGLTHPLVDTLAAWKPDESPILFIDALDASRGTGSEQAVKSLISEVLKGAPHWTVIASIRKFDLRYGKQYHRLFDGAPIDARFVDAEFPYTRHINVPKLGPDEIMAVRSQWPALDRIASTSGTQFNALLSSPFNLFLLGRILRSDSSDASPAKTQLDLLGEFWRQRVRRDTFAATEECAQAIDGLLRTMLQRRRLTAANADVPGHLLGALEQLLRDGILYQPTTTRTLSFAHHVLFDYALANVAFVEAEKTSVSDALVEASEDVLLVAPAITLALRALWEQSPTRDRFWSVSLSLAADTRLGSFLHSLPARVAAEAIASPLDASGLIEVIRQRSEPAVLLAKHLLSVVLAGVVHDVPRLGEPADPWCQIVEQMTAAALHSLWWPLNAAIATWSEGDLIAEQRASINTAARLMLAGQLADDAVYHDGSISAAIQAVIRTYSAAPEASERLLRRLLDEARIVEHGHHEFFWLANGFKLLAEAEPQLAADFLQAAFLAPLPSRDEKTSLGNSRILSLTSNTRQDFQGILHQLESHLPWFLETAPELAGRALGTLLAKRINSEASEFESRKLGEAELLGSRLTFRMDHSCVWWSPQAGHFDTNAKLLDSLYKKLVEAPVDDLATFRRVVLVGEVPAGLVAAFLRAAAARDDPGEVIQLLFSPDVLHMLDTSYDAAELVKRHYARLNSDQRALFQGAVASVEDDRRKVILLGCIPVGEQLINEELRDFKPSDEDLAATNHPHFRVTSGWGEIDDHWGSRQTANSGGSGAASLIARSEQLKSEELPKDRAEALKKLALTWPQVLELVAELHLDERPDSVVRNEVLDAVAVKALSICERAERASDLVPFERVYWVIERCLADDLAPLPVADAKREEAFAQSPGWGRPAPRVVAAEALMCWVRAAGAAHEGAGDLILKLARDPAVEVRHSILARSNLPCHAAPGLSEQLAKIAFNEEQNVGVLSFFIGSFDRYVVSHLDWAPEAVLALDSRLNATDSSEGTDLRSALVRMVLRFWATWDIPAAKVRLESWVHSPVEHHHRVSELLSCLRELVALGAVEPKNPKEEQVRQRGAYLFETLVENLATAHAQSISRMRTGEDVRQPLTDVTQLLDSAAHHLYFGSGAYALGEGAGRGDKVVGDPERHRFIQEYLPSLQRLAQIPYPSITHPILEIIEALLPDSPEQMLQLLFDAIRGGGQSGGYQFESLGADLVVKIARRFLADYSGLLTSRPEYRAGFVEMLNLFASNGWPEPRKLVYQLPEMLR